MKTEDVKIDRRSLTSAANGKKSRGPVTAEGKAIVSRNAVRHGILAKNIVLDDESDGRFSALLAALHEEHQPRTITEVAFIDNMAVSRWRQMRLWSMERAGLDHEIRKQTSALPAEDAPTRAALAFRALSDQSNTLELINRYEARYDRQFARSLQRFLNLRDHEKATLPNKPMFAG